MGISINNFKVNETVVTEIQPFVNSIYAIENLNADITTVTSAISDLSNSGLWFDRINGGRQTHNLSLTAHHSFNSLFEQITPIANTVVKSWGLTVPIELKHFFINNDILNSYTPSHNHYGCVLSGVFYINVPENSGNITFERPDTQECYFKGQELNPYSYTTFTLPPKENMLLLFPPFIKHRVELHKFKEHEIRVSISFDYRVPL